MKYCFHSDETHDTLHSMSKVNTHSNGDELRRNEVQWQVTCALCNNLTCMSMTIWHDTFQKQENIPKMSSIKSMFNSGIVVLVGLSGSGKSSWAKETFASTHVLSSDQMRFMLTDHEHTQACSHEAFRLLEELARVRLKYGRIAVLDATHVQKKSRERWLALAKELDVPIFAIWFDVPKEECVRRQTTRTRKVPEYVLERQLKDLEHIKAELLDEHFDGIVRLETTQGSWDWKEDVLRAYTPALVRKSGTAGVLLHVRECDIIGDVHGCIEELCELLSLLGWSYAPKTGWRQAHGRKVIFVGDLTDRGPSSLEVVELVSSIVSSQEGWLVLGNHDDKFMRHLKGNKVKVGEHLQTTIDELETLAPEHQEEFRALALTLFEQAPLWAMLDPDKSLYGGKVVVAHAAWKPSIRFEKRNKVRWFCLYGPSTGKLDEHGYPERLDWRPKYPDDGPWCVTGHTAYDGEVIARHKNYCLDTACVFGGKLSALRWPELDVVQVQAKRTYAHHHKGLDPEPTLTLPTSDEMSPKAT